MADAAAAQVALERAVNVHSIPVIYGITGVLWAGIAMISFIQVVFGIMRGRTRTRRRLEPPKRVHVLLTAFLLVKLTCCLMGAGWWLRVERGVQGHGAPGHYGFAFHTTSILANVILALSLSSLSKGWCLVRTRLTGAEQWSATVLAVALQLPTVYTLIFGDRALLAKLVLYTVFAEYLIGNGKLALERTALYIDRVQKVAFESGHAAEYVLVEKLSDIYRRKYAVMRTIYTILIGYASTLIIVYGLPLLFNAAPYLLLISIVLEEAVTLVVVVALGYLFRYGVDDSDAAYTIAI